MLWVWLCNYFFINHNHALMWLLWCCVCGGRETWWYSCWCVLTPKREGYSLWTSLTAVTVLTTAKIGSFPSPISQFCIALILPFQFPTPPNSRWCSVSLKKWSKFLCFLSVFRCLCAMWWPGCWLGLQLEVLQLPLSVSLTNISSVTHSHESLNLSICRYSKENNDIAVCLL